MASTLLLEDGSDLLLEDGAAFLLEDSSLSPVVSAAGFGSGLGSASALSAAVRFRSGSDSGASSQTAACVRAALRSGSGSGLGSGSSSRVCVRVRAASSSGVGFSSALWVFLRGRSATGFGVGSGFGSGVREPVTVTRLASDERFGWGIGFGEPKFTRPIGDEPLTERRRIRHTRMQPVARTTVRRPPPLRRPRMGL